MSTSQDFATSQFQFLNRGYNRVFRAGQLSIGLVVPIENYDSTPVPTMDRHIERVQMVENLGFSSVWIRDVPFNVPTFGDAGQTYDPFVYLGFLAAQTQSIAIGVASLILPLRHPSHVAKAAATADILSGGRLILGIASGDRPEEYPAHNITFENRGARFRECFNYIREMAQTWPNFNSPFGSLSGQMNMLPKPTAGKLPLLITGGSQQDPTWLAQNGDGWMLYPQTVTVQSSIIHDWRMRIQSEGRTNQPVLEPLYIDLAEDPNTPLRPIHLGYRLGANKLIEYLRMREEIGVNHVALNLRFNQADIESTINRIADIVLPEFGSSFTNKE
ncbi:MAG: LLM class oxidoreductase [Planctomycetota bacterium]